MTNHLCALLALVLAGLPSIGAATDSETMTNQLKYGLIGIVEMDVVVQVNLHPGTGDALDFSSGLREVVQSWLEEAGIRLTGQMSEQEKEAQAPAVQEFVARRMDVDPNSLTWRKASVPVLRVVADVLTLQGDGPAVLYVQTSLARPVRLAGWDDRSFEATVWSCEPKMLPASLSSWSDEVREIVLRQTESFIDARQAAIPYENDPPVLLKVSVLPRDTAGKRLHTWRSP
jgi:hypothetical protein